MGRLSRGIGLLTVAMGVAAVAGGAVAAAGRPELVSRIASGQAALGASSEASVSGDGSLVAFSSEAADLVPDDTNGVSDVFLLDRSSGTTRRVSLAADGSQLTARALMPALSADGRWLALRSDGPMSADAAPRGGLYLLDLGGGAARLIVADSADGRGRSDFPAISTDGGVVAFESTLPLPGAAATGLSQVLSWRRSDGQLSRASQGTDAPAREAAISGDGRVAAYVSAATDVLPGPTGGVSHVYVTSLATGAVERASVTLDGRPAGGDSTQPALSGDGRMVAFNSLATDLVAKDVNGVTDIFVRDLGTGQTRAVTDVLPADDVYHPGDSSEPALSEDGRTIAFASKMYTLTGGDTNRTWDVYWLRLDGGRVQRVSLRRDGRESERASWAPALSADGRWVAFQSEGDLVPEDGNGLSDVYLWGADASVEPHPTSPGGHDPTATPGGPHDPTATPPHHDATATPPDHHPTATAPHHDPSATPGPHDPTATPLHHDPTATSPFHHDTATPPHHLPTASPGPHDPTSTPAHHPPTATPPHYHPTPTQDAGGVVLPATANRIMLPILLNRDESLSSP